MVLIEGEQAVRVPEQGNLVRVRDRFWVVESLRKSVRTVDALSSVGATRHHLLKLVPIDDKGRADPFEVIWETEPGTEVRPQAELPDPSSGVDDVATFAAFLDAVRWGATASANTKAFQSPFRAGIEVEDYQLLPLVRALGLPRVNLLIADDVGLGKTVEAGLIAQELVLRNQAHKILVVCPPSLCLKWKREMGEQFGLRFEVVDTDYVRRLRRQRGAGVNPFRSHPRLIVSMEWLKFESQMRWFDEFLPPDPNTYPRAFDLLIVDEAHRIAPSAVGHYAKESLRTEAMRHLAPHFEHRLFLTATPHNGYPESFQALLEMLDPNRFTKGIKPSARDRDAVMVRRLKSHLRTLLPDGHNRFPERRIQAIEVDFPPPERALFELLDEYTLLRLGGVGDRTPAERAAYRLVTLLLKKRLLSSPAAFKHTLDQHIATLESTLPHPTTEQALLEAEAALEDEADDSELVSDQEKEAQILVAAALAKVDQKQEESLLARMRHHADQRHRRADAKTKRLMDWIGEICYPNGTWNNERVIVFTEYRATLNYLEELLTAPHPNRPPMQDRIEAFHGSLDQDNRERIIREFNYNPAQTKVRVLLATDAASEGIDLHRQCHRLVHVDVPFNPNRMEQRNGRIDRHGQKSSTVDIFHFAAATNDNSTVAYDHSFLFRVARKVDDIRDDLGSVASVLAARIEARMLGDGDHRLDDIDARIAERRDQLRVDVERIKQRFASDIEKVRDQYLTSAQELDLTPERVHRAVAVALRIDGQPPLRSTLLKRGGATVAVFEIGELTGTWGETLVGLYNEVERFRLPATFDPAVAHGHQDVLYLHVGHPFVARALRTLRAQVWGASADNKINRVTLRYADINEPVAVAHARIVVNGADGSTLDEVIEPAAVRIGGRHGRLNVGETREAVDAAGTQDPPSHVCARYLDQWGGGRLQPLLESALAARAEEVRDQRGRQMDAKREAEEKRLRETLRDLQESIRRELRTIEGPERVEQISFFDADENKQYQKDLAALRERVERIDDDIAAEVDILRRRYAVRDHNWFPVAIELLIPNGER